MVFVGILYFVVFTEAFPPPVIVMVNTFPLPVVALDAEMVIRPAGQIALSGSGFQQSLRQRDAGWNFVFVLLLDGQILVFPDIAVVRRKRRQVFSPAIRKCQQAKTAQ